MSTSAERMRGAFSTRLTAPCVAVACFVDEGDYRML
jgi:hypothetical protein